MNTIYRTTGSVAAAFALILLLFGAVAQNAMANDVGDVVVAIKGLEIFKGFDLKRKDARIGTKFVGEAFIGEAKVGLVAVSLDYMVS